MTPSLRSDCLPRWTGIPAQIARNMHSIADLIQLKRQADRPQDREDIERLNMILAETRHG